MVDDVGHQEEVAAEPAPADRQQLGLQPVGDLPGRRRVPPAHAFPAAPRQDLGGGLPPPRVGSPALGRQAREVELAERQLVGTGRRDPARPGYRLLGMQAGHLGARLQPELGVGPGSIRRGEGHDPPDGVQDVVHHRVAPLDVVHVVGGRHVEAQAVSDVEEDAVALTVPGCEVVRDLDGEPGAEDVPPPPGRRLRLLGAAEGGEPGYLSPAAAREGDEPLRAVGDRLEAGARPPAGRQRLRPLVEMHLRHETAEIGPPAGIPGQQDHMVALAPLQLGPQDRADPHLPAGEAEAHRPVHAVVVGERQRLHPHLRRPPGQVLHPGRPLPERVVGMDVEMDEGVRRHRSQRSSALSALALPRSASLSVGEATVGGRGWAERPERERTQPLRTLGPGSLLTRPRSHGQSHTLASLHRSAVPPLSEPARRSNRRS